MLKFFKFGHKVTKIICIFATKIEKIDETLKKTIFIRFYGGGSGACGGAIVLSAGG